MLAFIISLTCLFQPFCYILILFLLILFTLVFFTSVIICFAFCLLRSAIRLHVSSTTCQMSSTMTSITGTEYFQDMLLATGVTYEIVSNIPKVSCYSLKVIHYLSPSGCFIKDIVCYCSYYAIQLWVDNTLLSKVRNARCLLFYSCSPLWCQEIILTWFVIIEEVQLLRMLVTV